MTGIPTTTSVPAPLRVVIEGVTPEFADWLTKLVKQEKPDEPPVPEAKK